MVRFCPQYCEDNAEPRIYDDAGNTWTPVLQHGCSFNSSQFVKVMDNFVRNPNLNSSWLLRADILTSQDGGSEVVAQARDAGALTGRRDLRLSFRDFDVDRVLVRRLIPRNPQRDQPMDQSCVFLRSSADPMSQNRTRSLVVYIPHVSTPEGLPYYHPQVRGIAHLHEWDAQVSKGTVSLHLWHFDRGDLATDNDRLQRTARMLLQHVHKHGEGNAAGYVKRVTHDTMIPRVRVQDRHTQLKTKYAKKLVESWAEQTDALKHVFEDIGIAAFLIELWKDVYKEGEFPGFVDIGCGNGLLVYLLIMEGYPGWGFDARARRSWSMYNMPSTAPGVPLSGAGSRDSLQARVLLPTFVSPPTEGHVLHGNRRDTIHDGVFPKGTFIISNHADELTPWTPILAAQSESPFIMIPCCSHDLSGARFRAPHPARRDVAAATKGSSSAYASLVAWTMKLAEECGFEAETEMLRIPSTRNTAVVGRKWSGRLVDLEGIVSRYGGTRGYYENISKLLQGEARNH